MATSGTVGTTVVDVDKLLAHAIRRCGISTGELTAEHTDIAREVLYMYLSNLGNHGVNLWTVSRTVYGLVAYTNQIVLPTGAIDILNANKRTVALLGGAAAASSGQASNAFDSDTSTACIQTSPNGWISLTPAGSTVVASIGVMAYGNLTLTPVFEYTTDGSTWQTLYTPAPDQGATTISIPDMTWKWWDLTVMKSALGYRIRETGGATLALRELCFATTPTETAMSRLNRDDYNNLPNKAVTNTPLQYYVDRQRLAPVVNLYPTPNSSFEQVVLFTHRQIQDVSALMEEVEVPQRWAKAVMSNLAALLSLELPNMDLNRVQILRTIADQDTFEAEQEERDPSPIYLYPQISGYTR